MDLSARQHWIEFSEGSTIGSNLQEFAKLKKLSFYKIYNNRGIYQDVISSIQHLGDCSLESLVIDDESSYFLGSLYSMSSPPVFLIALELSGRLVKLPKWISRLHELSKLTLSATILGTANLVILSKLPSLFSLTFSISRKSHEDEMENVLKYNMNDSSEEIFIPGQGFTKLKLLRIFIPVLFPLKFSKNSTPELLRVELRFKMSVGISGMEELVKLQDVFITVDGQASEETKMCL
ncbi:hypothetical protein PR202_gb06237 [Eleusine coracana subsp. coracana]|uniref:Disease resistance R13L4/SHOC-2-like LRR domain-containing protein n=1 Tax=Eleusine coracana subsp. coracana TaxID=191504 RepID=A0AAV5E8V9_ELECO|nr:hypothetical protein PR202_gb06237 [Eleusine coracana subsp. coracana]